MQILSSFRDIHTGSLIPAQTIDDILKRQLGTNRIRCRIRVCDATLKRQTVCDQPPGWDEDEDGVFDPTDVSYWVLPDNANYKNDTTQGVHKSLAFTMLDPRYDPGAITYNPNAPRPGTLGFPFNPEFNYLELSQVTRNEKTGYEFESPLGFYVLVLPSAELRPGVRYMTWNALDLSTFVAQTPFISDYVVYQGYPGGVTQAMRDMLTSDSVPVTRGGTGITPAGNPDAGPAIPASMIQIPDTYNAMVPVDIMFTAGQNRGDAFNQLAEIINYYPLDVITRNNLTRTDPQRLTALDVFFRSYPIPDYNNGIPPSDFDYSAVPNGKTILESPINQDFSSQAGTYNYVRVECQNSQQVDPVTGQPTSYIVELENNNPLSTVSTANLKTLTGGKRFIPKYERNDKIPSLALVKLRAQTLLQQGAMENETIQASGAHQPTHESFDNLIIQISDKDNVSFVPSSAASPFVLTYHELPLKAGGGSRMKFNAQRVIAV